MQTTSPHFEIEIKSLLGTKNSADALKKALQAHDPNLQLIEQSKQLNHYFVGGDIPLFTKNLAAHIPANQQQAFQHILTHGKNFSVRTRLLNTTVILVIKASIDDTTSSNGIARSEFEAVMPDLTLDQLDQLLLDSGFTYQAKWSRERESFTSTKLGDITVSIDKNAGYGYLAEFEKVIDAAKKVPGVQQELRALMQELGVAELQQDQLERMFAFYNAHWPDYYGTDKVFTVK